MRKTLAILVTVTLAACGGATGANNNHGNAPGTAAALLVVSGDEQTATAGKELSTAVVVKVVDASGEPVEGQIVNFRVTEGGGSVFAGTALSDANGEARERWTMGTVAGEQKLEARAVDSSTGDAIVFATFTAAAVADAPASISVIDGNNQGGLPGATLGSAIRVRVLDQYANPVAGQTVQFTSTVGTGQASPASAVTDSSGEATTAWTLGDEIGTPQLTVQAGTATTTVNAYGQCPNADQPPVLSAGGGTCSLAPVDNVAITVTACIPSCGAYSVVTGGGSSAGCAMNPWRFSTDPGAEGLELSPMLTTCSGLGVDPVLSQCYRSCASCTPTPVTISGSLARSADGQPIAPGSYPLTVDGSQSSTIHSTLTIDPGAGTTCTL